jgi:acetoin utilization deacetylase AcuC-like enzyme
MHNQHCKLMYPNSEIFVRMALSIETYEDTDRDSFDDKLAVDHRKLYDAIKKVDWIKKDPFLKFKLREITNRWVEARHLLLHEEEARNQFLESSTDSGDSSPTPSAPKRARAASEESAVEIKSAPGSLSSSRSTTPEIEEIPQETEWECKKCTFLNPVTSENTSCAVCGCFRARSVEATGTSKASSRLSKEPLPVELFLKDRTEEVVDYTNTPGFDEVLSRKPATQREHRYTGPSTVTISEKSECCIYRSRFNLVSCGQAQEESIWIDAVERDLTSSHTFDEEMIFSRRHIAAKVKDVVVPNEDTDLAPADDPVRMSIYASRCISILGTSFPSIPSSRVTHRLLLSDWIESGVHSPSYLRRLVGIHYELLQEAAEHYRPFWKFIFSMELPDEESVGRSFFQCLLTEPRCDLSLHCLSHVEGDNAMDRFLLPSAFERADMIFSAMVSVWQRSTTAFVLARPPGHHCPSFEDRLIGLSSSGPVSRGAECEVSCPSRLQRDLAEASNMPFPPRELGMGFCALNALAVAVRRFQQRFNPEFQRIHSRSIRIAIVDLDIHAGNGTELVFRDSRSVLHLSVHRYGWLKLEGDFSERVMPGTHSYKDVGGMFGKNNKYPKGEGYAVNVNLRKADGNSEILSAFEAIGLPIMKQFQPDIVVIPCGFDGLKLSSVFKRRWGDEDITPPGMDAEYTPSVYGYIIGRIRSEIQSRVVAATEGGYDPIGVGLAARSVHKSLIGECTLSKPPIRVFNSDWVTQLNNMWQHQQPHWNILRN